ncbi:NAD(P)H-dependent flavin oxidoreductase [Gorillibacterium massiliense]|uniref:NAD(P)H-dependent flavin oxidoreductase n=1 Tax=Gorillibacterium massiliense TaxID=1280390 RepID=UPI0004B1D018|nr:nitronate monooxygenase [Gorillibacterium massiliense]
MWNVNAFTSRLRITYPIIQAGMNGGIAGSALAAAVSRAGGLGTLSASGMDPEAIIRAIREIRRGTDRPFAVNVHVPQPFVLDPSRIAKMQERLEPYRKELGLGLVTAAPGGSGPEALIAAAEERLREQLAAIAAEKVPAVSFTAGVLPPEWIDALKSAGTVLIGTATTVAEAVHLEEQGIDLVVGQGSEAGGERATFLGTGDQGMIGAMALIPSLADELSVPVIASGGISCGRSIAAALALGAAGVQLGSVFLPTAESGASPRYKDAVVASMEESTIVSSLYTGRSARLIRNQYVVELSDYAAADLPPHPLQAELTSDIRQAAEEQERAEYMALWAGQATRLIKEEKPAAQVMEQLIRETEQALSRLSWLGAV